MSDRWRVAECRGCGAPMIFARTGSGAKVPLDAEPCAAGNYVLEGDAQSPVAYMLANDAAALYTGEKRLSHFKTCPNAADFSKRKKR